MQSIEYASYKYIWEHSQLQMKEKLQMANIKEAAKRKIETVNAQQRDLNQNQNKIDVSYYV